MKHGKGRMISLPMEHENVDKVVNKCNRGVSVEEKLLGRGREEPDDFLWKSSQVTMVLSISPTNLRCPLWLASRYGRCLRVNHR